MRAPVESGLFHVDAFADRPFTGNPAAVCILDHPRDAEWMQAVAAELNLSETAFVHRAGPDVYGLRWFTPTTEVSLCGHATLAASHVLFEIGDVTPTATISFQTASGSLRARRAMGLIELDFPALDARPTTLPPEIRAVLGKVRTRGAALVGPDRQGHRDILVELVSEADLLALTPDLDPIRETQAPGLIVTAVSDADDRDFVSRYFVPSLGIDEDPVTGAIHCALAPYWAGRLERRELRAYQASGRGGHLHLRIADNRVMIGGVAMTVSCGVLRV
ncbi:MAG: PhzF family phenazine biosynthesis protein [Planctomycetes bacterium]|nr:PhzF family phenazine biosynthesis protein [Planctomycetota bacterium]